MPMDRLRFRATGRFQWWTYHVGHSLLLIRSPKSPARPTQIDILFTDVHFVSLPTVVDDVEIEEGSERVEVPLSSEARYYAVKGRDVRGHVIAGAAFMDESDRDYHDPSPLIPPWPPAAS